jgi:hypothetical protein
VAAECHMAWSVLFHTSKMPNPGTFQHSVRFDCDKESMMRFSFGLKKLMIVSIVTFLSFLPSTLFGESSGLTGAALVYQVASHLGVTFNVNDSAYTTALAAANQPNNVAAVVAALQQEPSYADFYIQIFNTYQTFSLNKSSTLSMPVALWVYEALNGDIHQAMTACVTPQILMADGTMQAPNIYNTKDSSTGVDFDLEINLLTQLTIVPGQVFVTNSNNTTSTSPIPAVDCSGANTLWDTNQNLSTSSMTDFLDGTNRRMVARQFLADFGSNFPLNSLRSLDYTPWYSPDQVLPGGAGNQQCTSCHALVGQMSQAAVHFDYLAGVGLTYNATLDPEFNKCNLSAPNQRRSGFPFNDLYNLCDVNGSWVSAFTSTQVNALGGSNASPSGQGYQALNGYYASFLQFDINIVNWVISSSCPLAASQPASQSTVTALAQQLQQNGNMNQLVQNVLSNPSLNCLGN